jgi:hypothetical protein
VRCLKYFVRLINDYCCENERKENVSTAQIEDDLRDSGDSGDNGDVLYNVTVVTVDSDDR